MKEWEPTAPIGGVKLAVHMFIVTAPWIWSLYPAVRWVIEFATSR